MSSNPCSHDLANCHAKEARKSAVPGLKISETGNWFRGFLRKCQSIFGQGPKGAGELKRLVLPSSRRQWEQTHSDHLTPRISIIFAGCSEFGCRPGITNSS